MSALEYITRKARGAWRRMLRGRPIDIFTTHVPVLMGLPRLRPIRRVVEFGCGTFSTRAFLDRAIYTDLTELISFETDPQWLAKVRSAASGDSRLKLELVAAPMAHTAANACLESADLVFVDD